MTTEDLSGQEEDKKERKSGEGSDFCSPSSLPEEN